MYDFLVQNWQFISTAILVVFAVIIALIKKRSILEILDNSGYKELVEFITKAESLFGAHEGKKKLEYVIENYANSKGISRSYAFDNVIEILVNKILDTPERKKGGKSSG